MARNDSINVGEVLRRARENSNLTQEEVAKKLNLGRDAILRIEKGNRKVTIDELRLLVNLYNMDLEDILIGDVKEDEENFKGIILAGGIEKKLYPVTNGTCKQLLPVYDKPMIYYPLSVLMQAGIKDILIITTREDQEGFKRLLKDGSDFGINLTYAIQEEPKGLAQAFTIGEEFIGDNPCAMVLGDNIFYGSGLSYELMRAKENAIKGDATIFGYQVKDPERFGIMELDDQNNVIGVEEKPVHPKSNFAITGLYFYPKGVSKLASKVTLSDRNRYEITSLNDMYLNDKKLKARLLREGYSWLDIGSFDSLLDASNMIRTIEENRDSVICSPEKIAYERNWINESKLNDNIEKQKDSIYGNYLNKTDK